MKKHDGYVTSYLEASAQLAPQNLSPKRKHQAILNMLLRDSADMINNAPLCMVHNISSALCDCPNGAVHPNGKEGPTISRATSTSVGSCNFCNRWTHDMGEHKYNVTVVAGAGNGSLKVRFCDWCLDALNQVT